MEEERFDGVKFNRFAVTQTDEDKEVMLRIYEAAVPKQGEVKPVIMGTAGDGFKMENIVEKHIVKTLPQLPDFLKDGKKANS